MYHFLVQTLIGLGGSQRSLVRVTASVRNFFVHLQNQTRLMGPLSFFFATVRLFSRIFNVSKGSLLQFFDILQQTGFSKKPKGSPLTIFGIVRFFKMVIFVLKLVFSVDPHNFYFQLQKSGFRVLSRMKGILCVFRNCFLKFS